MAQPSLDQRGTRRFPLSLPVTVHYPVAGGTELPAHTKDVSSRGVYFFVETALSLGSNIEFTMLLPPEITLTEELRVRCIGHVVRVENHSGGKIGVAAAIERYEFVPSTPAGHA